MNKLFSEFAAVSSQQWKDKLCADLKGKTFENLISSEGTLPFYHSDTHRHFNPLPITESWESVQWIDGSEPKKGNQQALEALQNGMTALCISNPQDLKTLLQKAQAEKKNLMERCKEAGIANPTIANCTENEIRQKKLQLLRDEQCEKNQIKDSSGKVLEGEGKCTEFVIHQNTIQGIYDSQCKDLYNNGEGMVNDQNGMAQGPADCNKFSLAQYREQLKKDEECAAMGMKDEKGQVAKGPDNCNDITIKHNRKMDKKGASNKILLDKCVELGIYTEAESKNIKFNRDFEIKCNKKTSYLSSFT